MLNFFYFAVGVTVLYLIRSMLITPWKVQIEVVPNRPPVVKGVVATSQSLKIQYFLQHDLRPQIPFTIFATKERTGRLRMLVKGEIDAGTRQQIRNFLMGVL